MGNFPFLGLSGRVGSFPHAFDGHGPSEERRRIVRKAPEELVQPGHWSRCALAGASVSDQSWRQFSARN